MTQREDNELLTPEEVVTKLKLTVDTIYRWIQDREFPNVKVIGRSYRIPESDVQAFWARHTRRVFPG